MKRWNGLLLGLRCVDPSCAEPTGLDPGTCRVCSATLPLDRNRVFCLEHSDYPQRVQQLAEAERGDGWRHRRLLPGA